VLREKNSPPRILCLAKLTFKVRERSWQNGRSGRRLASMRPGVQSPVLPRKKTKKRGKNRLSQQRKIEVISCQ
jgi:hypothetical protein